MFAGDLAAVRFIEVSVIAGCPQGKSWLYLPEFVNILLNVEAKPVGMSRKLMFAFSGNETFKS